VAKLGVEEFKLLSAGIDIGTTTTQLVISELTMKNRLPGARIPKIEITEKKVLYQSPIYMTPIVDHKEVDAKSLKAIIELEYGKAGFNLDDIDTGAVIITGETAKKENAEKIIHQLAEFAGDFVVAVAGPQLESVLAGKGSGASDYSKKHMKKVVNLDIGGGTTNIAVFYNGNVEDATCVNVGGRLIEIDEKTERVSYVSKPANLFINAYKLNIKTGEKVIMNQLEAFCDRMVELTERVLKGNEIPVALAEILMGAAFKSGNEYDCVMFSGGVAEYIYGVNQADEGAFKYGDIGPILAKAFKKSTIICDSELITAENTIRATVIGAGTQSMGISGSTVFVKAEMLPIRNVPVAKIYWQTFPTEDTGIRDSITAATRRYEGSMRHNALAISLPCPKVLSFENVQRMANGIYGAWQESMDPTKPLVVIVEKDIAKVLGQTLQIVATKEMKFICIDSIYVNDGDYIDVGRPMSKDDVVPVIIKTLVF
jgi:ethanolamine utilization protein EutA